MSFFEINKNAGLNRENIYVRRNAVEDDVILFPSVFLFEVILNVFSSP